MRASLTYHYYLVNYSFELAHLIWAMPEINRFFLCDVLPKGGSNFPLQKYYNTKSKYVSFFLNQDFLNIQGGGVILMVRLTIKCFVFFTGRLRTVYGGTMADDCITARNVGDMNMSTMGFGGRKI